MLVRRRNQHGILTFDYRMRRSSGTKSVSEHRATDRLLVSLWRRAIVHARIRLASDDLTPAQRDYLWQSVDCREWLIKLVAHDFAAELEQIDREIEQELRPARNGR